MMQIGLHSGGILTVDPINIDQLTVEDIAYGLARVSRFGGQAGAYSVAEHSVRLARYWADDHSAARSGFLSAGIGGGLLHDAPEALGIGDVNSFIKTQYAIALRDLDSELTEAIWDRFSAGYKWCAIHDGIKPYDTRLGTWEAQCFGFPHDASKLPSKKLPRPTIWSHRKAERLWLGGW